MQAYGRQVLHVRCDLTDEPAVVAAISDVEQDLGALDIVVNNAGVQLAKPLLEMTGADWDRVLNVNLRGAFFVAREAARYMVTRNAGRIINTCSQLGTVGREHYTAYSASKGGLVSLTRALARELAPHGILVNGVGPGLIDTGFDPIAESRKSAIAASLPLGRLAEPEDVVGAYIFLASDDARFFCGQVIHPNGGQVMY